MNAPIGPKEVISLRDYYNSGATFSVRMSYDHVRPFYYMDDNSILLLSHRVGYRCRG